MIEEYAAMKKSPLFPLFYELQKTRKFQLRIKPLLSFLVKLNNFIGRKGRSSNVCRRGLNNKYAIEYLLQMI